MNPILPRDEIPPFPIGIGRDNRTAEIERETAERRRRQAIDRLRGSFEFIEREKDLDLVESVERPVDDVLWSVIQEHRRRNARRSR